MITARTWERLGLILTLLIGARIFSGAFDKYFNHDSLFYLIHSPQSWHQFAGLLTAPDPSQQYRPLTLGLMTPAIRQFGVNPHPYHWIPLLLHSLNICLFYLL